MRFFTDWSRCYTSVKELETDLRISFSGPGFYLSPTDTLLIIGEPPDGPCTRENVWYAVQPDGTIWRAFVWNSPFEELIFSAIAPPPTRMDSRFREV